jgi:hypothetical protein
MRVVRTDPGLDAAEDELDRAHRVHPLLSRPYHVALFHLLAASDRLGMKTQAAVGQQQNAIALDMIVNAMRYAVAWITAECPRIDSPPEVKGALFEEAEDLLERGRQFMFFVAAYSFWRRGLIDTTVTGQQYSISRGLETDTRYEAYDRLIKTTTDMATYEAPDGSAFDEAIRLRLKKGHVLNAIPLDRKLIAEASRAMATAHESVYQLPSDWRFTAFDLREYRIAMNALRGVVFVWNIAAAVSAGYGAAARPFWPYVVPKKQLFEAVRDVTGLNRSVLRAIFNLLEYGSSGIRLPDPALQPLLALETDSYVLSSMLLLGTSPERNLIVLLNQLPAERSVYAALVEQKEALLRDGLVAKLPPSIRAWTGRIPNRPDLPDVDLALLDESARVVLLLELKWFIDPAEPREMVQRGEELAKGVKQCKDLAACTGGRADAVGRVRRKTARDIRRTSRELQPP